MDLNELKTLILQSPKAQFSDYALSQCNDLLSALDSKFYTSLALALELDLAKKRKNGFFGLDCVAFYTKQVIKDYAENLAQACRIKNFRESTLQEKNILTMYFLKKELQNLPLWLSEVEYA